MALSSRSATNLRISSVDPAKAGPPRVRLFEVSMRPPELDRVTVKAEDGSRFHADTRWFPIVVLKLDDKASEVGAKVYYEWLWVATRYAASLGQKLIVINDFTHAEMPSPVVRKYMAEEAGRIQAHEGFGHWVPVLPNALIRGLATALVWMSGSADKRQAHFTGTIPQALEKATKLLTELGLTAPNVDPAAYAFPKVD